MLTNSAAPSSCGETSGDVAMDAKVSEVPETRVVDGCLWLHHWPVATTSLACCDDLTLGRTAHTLSSIACLASAFFARAAGVPREELAHQGAELGRPLFLPEMATKGHQLEALHAGDILGQPAPP